MAFFRRRLRARVACVATAWLVASGCAKPAERRAPESGELEDKALIDRELASLRQVERALLSRQDEDSPPASNLGFGSNPTALTALADDRGRPGYALVTRGDSELVLLDEQARVTDRAPAPAAPIAVAAPRPGELLCAGELEASVASYRVADGKLARAGSFVLPGARAVRALAADRRAAVAVDFTRDRLFTWPLEPRGAKARPAGVPSELTDRPSCAGPFFVTLSENFAAVGCLFEQRIAVFSRDDRGVIDRELASVTHDGPLWGCSLLERNGELVMAAGGVEDRPLDRRDKVFGYVDSFVYLYRLGANRRFERVSASNVSELGVVTPKVVRLEATPGGVRALALGYGSDRFATLEWRDGNELPASEISRGVPGCSDAAFADGQVLCTSPLFDALVVVAPGKEPEFRALDSVRAESPSPSERLGEALFFTTLIAPDASSEGRLSRFTCETCHFEGGTDGRVHHSGRGDVRVSTRPLLGLAASAPYFSRAHDPDLTAVSHNEFRVANRGNPVNPWFTLRTSRFPWLAELGVNGAELSPLELRKALLSFLARLTHAQTPFVRERSHFSDFERRGAELFRETCVRCHSARRVATDAASEVPFEAWESVLFSGETPLVWSNGAYERVAVLPYVDPRGTRTPSLRRLYLKRPYLTNGTARTLEELLAMARFDTNEFAHAPSKRETTRALNEAEKIALAEFLRLL